MKQFIDSLDEYRYVCMYPKTYPVLFIACYLQTHL